MTTLAITEFRGPYWFLSNFSPSPIQFGQWIAPTVEHAFQACKAADPDAAALILAAATPKAAKQLGREVTLLPDWERVKLGVMRDLLRLKFEHGSHLALALLYTGDALLVEGNTWGDRFWGAVNGVGENWLGHLLMAQRAELRAGVA